MNRDFYQPLTLIEALKYRRDLEESTLLAGGTDLVVNMHKDKGPQGDIIDLSKVTDLKEISVQNGKIKIGAMVTCENILDSEILWQNASILCRAAGTVGAPQIRNRATLGGNICNASPAADMVPPLVCLEARLELQSIDSDGVISIKKIALEEFIIEANKTILKDTEILTSIIFDVPQENAKMSFKKIGRRNALAISRLNGACILNMEKNVVSGIALVIGSATAKPIRFSTVENFLSGRELSDEVLKDAGALASSLVLDQTGHRSSSSYKLPVVSRFTVSLIEDALTKEVYE